MTYDGTPGDECKLWKITQFRWFGTLLVIFAYAARNPAHNNGCEPLPEKVGHAGCRGV